MNPPPPPSARWIKRLACATHQVASTAGWIARPHLAVCRWMAGRLSRFRRQQLLNSLRGVTWPEAALSPTTVRLGADTVVRLQPHNGEFDFEAVLGGALEYEPEVFSFLDSRV
jgi:hypothetical protein